MFQVPRSRFVFIVQVLGSGFKVLGSAAQRSRHNRWIRAQVEPRTL